MAAEVLGPKRLSFLADQGPGGAMLEDAPPTPGDQGETSEAQQAVDELRRCVSGGGPANF